MPVPRRKRTKNNGPRKKANPPDATRRNVHASLQRDVRLALKLTDALRKLDALAERVSAIEDVLADERSGKLTAGSRQRIRKLIGS